MSVYIGCGTDKGDVFAIDFNCSTMQFTDKFIDREAHMSPVTGLIADKIALISSGRNGTIQSYSLDLNKRLHSFDNIHESSITSLSLSSDKDYLLSSADDGTIVIWKRSHTSWENVKAIDKHKKSVMVAIHPSDKLALSICKDNTFRVWDLYSGRQCHKMPMRQPFVSIKISKTGKHYMLRTFNLINIYELEEASLKFTVKAGGNIKDCVFVDDSKICVGELKKICFYVLSDPVTELVSIDLGQFQCKHLAVVEASDKQYLVCAVASESSSAIQVYDITSIGDGQCPVLLGSYEVVNSRITAMASVYK